ILPTGDVSPLFQAALEATEEAVYNALFQATTTTGSGRTVEAIPIAAVREILKRHNLGRSPARPAAAPRLEMQPPARPLDRSGARRAPPHGEMGPTGEELQKLLAAAR